AVVGEAGRPVAGAAWGGKMSGRIRGEGVAMNLPEFLTEWPMGEIVLTGNRIGLYHVISYHNDGLSAEQLHEQFPTLSLELSRKVLAFYEANRAEVDAYVARCDQEIEHLRATTPRAVNWEELRRKFEAMKRAGNS